MKLILFHLSCTKAQPQILSYGQINWALSLFALYDLFKCRALLSFVIFTSHVKNDLKLCEQTNTSVPSLSSPGQEFFKLLDTFQPFCIRVQNILFKESEPGAHLVKPAPTL